MNTWWGAFGLGVLTASAFYLLSNVMSCFRKCKECRKRYFFPFSKSDIKIIFCSPACRLINTHKDLVKMGATEEQAAEIIRSSDIY